MHSGRQTEKEHAREGEGDSGKGWERAVSRWLHRNRTSRANSRNVFCTFILSAFHFSSLSFSLYLALPLFLLFSALPWLLFSLLFMLNVLNVFQLKIVATDCSGVPFLGIIDFETCNNNNITNVTNCFFVLCFSLFFFLVFFLWINFVMQSRRVVHGGGRMWHVACGIRLLCEIWIWSCFL